MRITLSRVGLVLLNILVFIFEEGWIIAMVAIFPFWFAVLLVSFLLSLFAVTSSYLCGLGELPPILKRYIERQKEKSREKLVKVVGGSIWVSVLTTAIVVSPTTSAVMLHLMGLNKLKVYLTDIFFSVISGTIWCGIYGGGILLLRKII